MIWYYFFLGSILFSNFLFSKPLVIQNSAQSAILINAETGKVLFAKNPYEASFPASVTKMAVLLWILQKNPDLDQVIEAPLDCLVMVPMKTKIERKFQDLPYRLEPDGTSFGVRKGEKLTVRDLLYGMMLVSGNDAGNVLAHYFSAGDIGSFMNDVNIYLESIGCKQTKLYNPHGLHYPKHVTTAADLAILAREAIKNPIFLEIIGAISYERPKTNKQPARTIYNQNGLLKPGSYFYPKAFGIKTGFHAKAGYNFVSAAKNEDRKLISVVLGGRSYKEIFKDTVRMFDAAFEEKKLVRLLLNHSESVFIKTLRQNKKIIKATLYEDLTIDYYPSEEEDWQPELVWNDVKLPIKKGAVVGKINVKDPDGRIVKTAYLYSDQDVNQLWYRNWKINCSVLAIASLLAILIVAISRNVIQKPKEA